MFYLAWLISLIIALIIPALISIRLDKHERRNGPE